MAHHRLKCSLGCIEGTADNIPLVIDQWPHILCDYAAKINDILLNKFKPFANWINLCYKTIIKKQII